MGKNWQAIYEPYRAQDTDSRISFALDFDSLSDAAHFALQNNRWNGGSRHTYGHLDWFGTRSFEQAVEMIDTGWPEGRAEMIDHMENFKASTFQPRAAPRTDYDVAGMYPDVTRAIAGMPDAMVCNDPNATGGTPTLSIYKHISASSADTFDRIKNYGIALMCCIDKLEEDGVRCEVFLVKQNTHTGGGNVRFRIQVKKSGEPMELDRMCYMLGHASINRRLGWGLVETSPSKSRDRGSQGSPWTPRNGIDIPEYGVLIPSIDKLPGKANTVKEAWKYLLPFLKRAIENPNEEGEAAIAQASLL